MATTGLLHAGICSNAPAWCWYQARPHRCGCRGGSGMRPQVHATDQEALRMPHEARRFTACSRGSLGQPGPTLLCHTPGQALQRSGARLRTAARGVADDVDERAGRLRSGEAGGQHASKQAAHSRRRRWGRIASARTHSDRCAGQAPQGDEDGSAEVTAGPERNASDKAGRRTERRQRVRARLQVQVVLAGRGRRRLVRAAPQQQRRRQLMAAQPHKLFLRERSRLSAIADGGARPCHRPHGHEGGGLMPLKGPSQPSQAQAY